MITAIPTQSIDLYWLQVRHFIKKACQYNSSRSSLESYYDDLTAGNKQLWVAKDGQEIIGILITSFIGFPLKMVCSIDICAGKWDDNFLPNILIIENWAKENGCSQMFFSSRIGFLKKLKSQDYKLKYAIAEKDL